jgi:hypothetical protein
MGDGLDKSQRSGIRAIAWRFAVGYRACALMFVNILVAYVLVNLALGVVIGIRNAFQRDESANEDVVTARYGPELLAKIYPDMEPDERQQMLTEAWAPPFTYSDYNHFRTRPLKGKYVNVTPEGYRLSRDQGPWPPASECINVFVFGGSTTYGSGVQDHQSLRSYLQ